MRTYWIVWDIQGPVDEQFGEPLPDIRITLHVSNRDADIGEIQDLSRFTRNGFRFDKHMCNSHRLHLSCVSCYVV